MLTVTQPQMRRFQEVMLAGFERRLLAHIERYFPIHWRLIGGERMAEIVRFGIERARAAGLRTERDGFLYHSLMLRFGSHFDTDPQYPWLAAALNDDTVGPRSERLVNAHDAAMDYLDRVAGPKGEHMAAALHRMQATVLPEVRQAPRVNFDYLADMLEMAWPQKARALGEEALRGLAHSVMPAAKSGGLTTPAGACLYVIACFMFGHALGRDPQFPWAQQILSRRLPQEQAAQAFAQAFETRLAALA